MGNTSKLVEPLETQHNIWAFNGQDKEINTKLITLEGQGNVRTPELADQIVVSDFSSANVSRSGLRGTPEEAQALDSTKPSEVTTS